VSKISVIIFFVFVLGLQSYFFGSSLAVPYDDPYYDIVNVDDPLEVIADIPSRFHDPAGGIDLKRGLIDASNNAPTTINFGRVNGLNASNSAEAAQNFISGFKSQDGDVGQAIIGTENITYGGNQSTIIQYTRNYSDGDILSFNAVSYFVVGTDKGNVVYSLDLTAPHNDKALYEKQLTDYRNMIKSLEFFIGSADYQH